jgi:hypothetical protein
MAGQHRSGNTPLHKTKRADRLDRPARFEKVMKVYLAAGAGAAAAMSMLVSLSVSPSTVPFTVT